MDSLLAFIGALFWLGFWVVVILAIIALIYFNKLRRLKEDIKEKRSNVRGSVKKMVDILNKVGDVVKGYKGYEQVTHLKISQDQSTGGLMSAYQQSQTLLNTMLTAADRFPELKASGLYQDLIKDIRQCHTEIEHRGQEFNRSVTAYNVVRGGIPAVLFAGLLGFRRESHLEFDTGGMEEEVDSIRAFNSNDEDRVEQLLSSAGSHLLDATKVFASQAGQAGRILAAQASATGKLVSERIKERAAGPKYFYLPGGQGMPKGPASLEEIRSLVDQGVLSVEATMAAPVGAENWTPLTTLFQNDPLS